MSGMIAEGSANGGSCAQSCRKDYVLADTASGEELDRGYLISARDLGAWEHLAEIADAGIHTLKVEGRKKKPEYVATVTHGYRDFLDRLAPGDWRPPTPPDVQPRGPPRGGAAPRRRPGRFCRRPPQGGGRAHSGGRRGSGCRGRATHARLAHCRGRGNGEEYDRTRVRYPARAGRRAPSGPARPPR